MREERANFRFLLIACALLLVAAVISVVSFVSLVHAGDDAASAAQAQSAYVVDQGESPTDSYYAERYSR